MEFHRLKSVLPLLAIYAALCLSGLSQPSAAECKAWLVQSIPTDMPDLHHVPGVLATADVFRWLAGNSSKRLDIMTQYWQLIAQPDDPRSGDYGYTKEEMEGFGATEGLRVYKAIEDAADRDVKVRLLQHSGVYPDYTKEPTDLAAGSPNIESVTLLLSKWWGSGVVHVKVWISDRQDVYIGSANNDWKSLTQVKEAGIYIVGCPEVARKVRVYFNNLWKLASLNASEYTTTTWDQQWQTNRTVPCWSHFVSPELRCSSPLPHYVEVPKVYGYPGLSNPFTFQLPLETPGTNDSSSSEPYDSYLSFAPPEVKLQKIGILHGLSLASLESGVSSATTFLSLKTELSFGTFPADEQAWVDTITSVGTGAVLRINTMDWLGQSQYTAQTIYWPSLSTAISEVVFSKNATVQILVAKWTHFIQNTDQYLKSLLHTNVLCHSSTYNHCSGKVEIKYYEVPGCNSTGPAIVNGTQTGNLYPGYTRVNHGKYAVSDVRAHIGTSNLIWDYFYTTAGVSFGTYNPSVVSQLQEIFDADWDSPYTVAVEPLTGGVASAR